MSIQCVEEYRRQKEAAQALIKELDNKIEFAHMQLSHVFDNQMKLINQLTEKVKNLEANAAERSNRVDAVVDDDIARSAGIKKILSDNQPLIQQYVYLRTMINCANISNEERAAIEPHYHAYRATLMRAGINPDAETVGIILDN